MKRIIITFILFTGLFTMNAFAQNTRIKLTFEGNEIYALIINSKAGNDFLSLLPLNVKAEDFNSTEKIFYLSKEIENYFDISNRTVKRYMDEEVKISDVENIKLLPKQCENIKKVNICGLEVIK